MRLPAAFLTTTYSDFDIVSPPIPLLSRFASRPDLTIVNHRL